MKQIRAEIAFELIIAGLSEQRVVAVVAAKRIVAVASFEQIIAWAAIDLIGAGSADDRVIATAADDPADRANEYIAIGADRFGVEVDQEVRRLVLIRNDGTQEFFDARLASVSATATPTSVSAPRMTSSPAWPWICDGVLVVRLLPDAGNDIVARAAVDGLVGGRGEVGGKLCVDRVVTAAGQEYLDAIEQRIGLAGREIDFALFQIDIHRLRGEE